MTCTAIEFSKGHYASYEYYPVLFFGHSNRKKFELFQSYAVDHVQMFNEPAPIQK